MYKAYITRIKNLRKHNNADRLLVGECFGNNVIVTNEYEDNQLGVYFPTDGKIGIEFAEHNNLMIKKDENGNNVGGYLDPVKRNIRAISLRGEKSDGLFMPLESLSNFCDISKLKEGFSFDSLNGVLICEKYIPRGKKIQNNDVPNKKTKKSNFPYFEQHIETEQLCYNESAFKVGDICIITLKMHGTSHRVSYNIGIKKKKRWFRKPKTIKSWEYISGSRRVNINFDFGGGYYGDANLFRKHWHDFICPKLMKGETVYGEIVGWVNDNTTIMGQCNNKKVGKEFVKKYGDKTIFSYGCEKGKNDFYVYRITFTNEDGYVVEYPTWYAKIRAEQMGLKFVPIFDVFLFTNWEDLMKRVEEYYDGEDTVDPSHIKEGVVVRIENRNKFTAYKHKNFNFKLLEGIIKDVATEPDMEEVGS